jgi:hypothetical protein
MEATADWTMGEAYGEGRKFVRCAVKFHEREAGPKPVGSGSACSWGGASAPHGRHTASRDRKAEL